jgi:hemerythrin-like domain-containing protein
MPISIQQSHEPGCNDPVGLLTACHRRVEHFLQVLSKVAERYRGGELAAEDSELFGRALRYFREAAPKHTGDEECDLFPALARVESSAQAVLDRLHQDHIRATDLHRRVDELGMEWLQAGTLTEPKLIELKSALHDLLGLYDEHIRIEEQQLFPLAQRVLDAGDLEAIGRGMADRRGIPFIPRP